jgi:hypothetical protein
MVFSTPAKVFATALAMGVLVATQIDLTSQKVSLIWRCSALVNVFPL